MAGLKVGIYKYWGLVYSHMLSIVGVNAFSYVQVVLFDKKMHNPTALLALTVVDFALVLIWALVFKKLYAGALSQETPFTGIWKNTHVSSCEPD